MFKGGFIMKNFRTQTTIYVDPASPENYNGFSPVLKDTGFRDANDGPFRYLSKAFDTIQEMREDGINRPITIKIMGNENLSAPQVVNSLMSNVTVEPYGDKEVLISGGKQITGWKKDTFNGKECFSAYIPEVAEGKWNFTDLYVDGLRADYTRYPAEGEPELTILEAENPGHGLFDHSKWFIAKKEDVEVFRNFRNFGDCFISFLHYWIDEHTPIESYDIETGKVVMKYTSNFNINHEFSYFLENVAEMFANKNEWYLDRPSGTVYYIPRCSCQTPESIVAYAPVISKLIEFRGAEGVHFKNIKFAYTRGDYSSVKSDGKAYASDNQAVSEAHGSISFANSRNCSLENCTLHNFGVHGVTIDSGCSSIRITHCDIYDGGAGGVKINGGGYGSPEHTHVRNCVVSDNRIEHCGRRYFAACGVLLMNAYDCEISHNEICDIYYTGVSVGWNWGYTPSITKNVLVTKNHIHHLGQGKLSDMGGVYLLGPQAGTVVSNNVIHDIKCKEYGGWALYTDEGSSHIRLENNVCYNTSSNSYHQHYGANNLVCNNIFAFSTDKDGALKVSRFERHTSIAFFNNIVYTDGIPMYALSDNHVSSGTVIADRNIFFDVSREPVFMNNEKMAALDQIRSFGMDEDSIIADPKFKDPANFDFSLEADSPAYAIGFKDINISDVGIRK